MLLIVPSTNTPRVRIASQRIRVSAARSTSTTLIRWLALLLTLALLFAYAPKRKQLWDVTEIGIPWLKLVRNSLNAEVVSFRHPDFLAVVACHGSAQLALYDEAMWDKYQLAKLTGDKFKKNVFIEEKGEASDEAATIPALMKRGVVFTACHNAVWEQTSKLLESGVNPDKLSHGALAAEMTNHLVPGVVLNPGAVATILEAQLAGYHYIR